MFRLAVDFDGTIVDREMRLRPGAAEALLALRAMGHVLILHSCRCNTLDTIGVTAPDVAAEEFYATGRVAADVSDQWDRFEEMRAALEAAGLWGLFDEVWQRPGKPIADMYLDDRAELPDWVAVARDFGLRSGHEQGRPGSVGQP